MRPILIIDDDSAFRNVIADLLQQSGWRVLQAGDGQEGLELAKVHRPDIIFCDLLMTPVNGFQFCSRLREIESLRHARIIVTSGREFEADRRSALAAGADEYLTKPLDPATLRQMLARADRTETPAQPASSNSGSGGSSTGLTFRFWGVRGSIATPGVATLEYGGNTSCVEVRAGGQIIILDGGTGLRLLGGELVREFGDRPLDITLLLTHTHWDHIQGLPFFLPLYRPNYKVRILGFEGARKGLHTVLNSQMETPFFPVALNDVAGNVSIEELSELKFSIGSVQAEAAFANHPGICVGYKLSHAGRSLSFFPDNELRAESVALKENSTSAGVAFARQENSRLADFLREADALIMDTQYDGDEYKQHLGWGHGCMEEVVRFSLEARIGKLFLFHHDPDHNDQKIREMVEQARRLVQSSGGTLEVEAAREGLMVQLPARLSARA